MCFLYVSGAADFSAVFLFGGKKNGSKIVRDRVSDKHLSVKLHALVPAARLRTLVLDKDQIRSGSLLWRGMAQRVW